MPVDAVNGRVMVRFTMSALTTLVQQAVATTGGTTAAIDGGIIGQADLDRAILKQLLDLLPDLVTALSNPAVLAAATPAAREARLLAQATAVAQSGGLTPASVAVAVGIDNRASASQPIATLAAGIQLTGTFGGGRR